MLKWLIVYGASAAVFVAGDMAWLSVMGPRLYRPVLGPLLADKPRLSPALAFYLLYLVGVLVLAVAPALKGADLRRALTSGAVLGLVAYATYDLTNQATLRSWATRLTLADMAWGALLTAAAAGAGFLAGRAVSAG